MNKEIWKSIKPEGIIFIVVLLAFCPAYLFSYAFNDDYALLGQVLAGFCDTFKWDIMSGRPLFAYLRLMAYKVNIDLMDLAYLRYFSAMCAAGFSVHLYMFLKRKSILESNFKRAFLALSLGLLPTFQVYTSWATCCVYVMATWLSLMSYDCLSGIKSRYAGRLITSFLLISAAFAIYQPAGMALLAFAFIEVCLSEKKVDVKKCILSFALTACGVVSSAVMTKIIPLMMYGETFQRAALTHDLIGKMKWFVSEPMRIALSNYDITLSLWYLVISIIVTIVGLFFVFRLSDGVWKLLLVAMFGIGSFSLSLIVSESWATWRTMPGLTIIFTSLFIVGLLSVCDRLPNFGSTLACVLAAVIAASCSYNIVRGFVIPQRSELQSLAAELSNKVSKDYSGKVMIDITNPTYNSFSNVQRTDEFGNISLANEWAPWGMALYLKNKKGFSFEIPYKPTINNPSQCVDNCVIISTGSAMLKSTTDF
ncbi:heme biosynthesis HemY N-terminal domain-containing protein [Pantoea sp. PSNIH6]|uniref:heme biosynthesis HemY N-terminal domain-containing protein n=1 Tax=Pantoea sp. GABEPS69 TaxID=3028805 RepID=UPI000CDD6FE1|nr:hypothetical protein C3408_14130 [Pantoea alvi]